tara:strand:- start:265 stop:492 length:228 start_codon:yes stop_codon:yes gene_type:complete
MELVLQVGYKCVELVLESGAYCGVASQFRNIIQKLPSTLDTFFSVLCKRLPARSRQGLLLLIRSPSKHLASPLVC